MKFCPECDNMLYPLEERERKTLFLLCKRCGYRVEAALSHDERCVFQSRVAAGLEGADQKLDVNPQVVDDPTLQSTNDVECRKCGASDCVFFSGQASELGAGVEDSLSLVFVCRNKGCLHFWRVP